MTGDDAWYYAQDGKSFGPMTLQNLVEKLPTIEGTSTLVYGPTTNSWIEARHIPAIADALRGAGGPPAPPPRTRRADEIDYEIFGGEMQYVEVTLDPGEMVMAEPGAMMYMSSGIQMETLFGDPGNQGGFWSKVVTAGKRALTGESLFITTFSNPTQQREHVAFAAPFPGKILPLHLDQLGGELICQKESFVCAARGIQINIAFQKRFGVGLFGGEGFIMQRLVGDGIAMVHAGGNLMRRTLAAGEFLKVDTGCLVALAPTVDYNIQFVGGIKNTLFGGEGLFLVTLTGPGDIWLQSLPFSRLAGRVMAAAAHRGGHREEGSMLGGLGRLLDGDNN